MQKLAEVCIRRPVFATMLIGAMVVAGATGHEHLAVDRFPAVDLPTVTVRTELPGASPEEVEVQVSQVLEETVNTVQGLSELRSISGTGTSFILATFVLERDIDAAAQDVRDAVARVLRRLPRDAFPPIVGKFDNDSTPVLTIAVSGPRAMRELTEVAWRKVKQLIERCDGVGEVRLVGGHERAIDVRVDAGRLAAYQLPITQVRDAIARQNSDVPGGNVTTERFEQTLRTIGRLRSAELFEQLVLATVEGVPIRIADIGSATDGTRELRSTSRLDGQPTVVLEVRRQSTANTVRVIDGVKQRLAQILPSLPPDLRVEIIRDQSNYIHAALHEINQHLILGAILASLVVLLFMRNWRSTFIAAIAIPTSVVTTFGVMWAFDFTLNSVTMLALVLMVGIVIDDAIVVLENVFRFVEEKGVPPREAARDATKEIALAVLATTLSLVVIFVPISFMSSISGRFLFQFGITAAAAVLVSLLVSFTLTPTMCARMLRPPAGGSTATPASRAGFYGWLERRYLRLMRVALRARSFVLLLSAGVIATCVPLYQVVKQDYIPTDVDEGEFEVNVNGPEGASLKAMDAVMHRVENELRQVHGIRLMLTTVGGGFISGVNQGSVYVRIAPHAERRWSFARQFQALLAGDPARAWRGNYTQREVMQQIRARLRQLPDLRVAVRNQRSFNLGGGPFDIDFSIRGPDLHELLQYVTRLKAKAEQLGGFADTDVTLRLDKPELQVEIDRARAAELGVESSDVALALRLMVGGDTEVSRWRDPGVDDEYYVQLRLREEDRVDPARMLGLLVPRRNGPPVRLEDVASFVPTVTASRIDRIDRQRQASLRAQVAPGFALADRVAALRQAAAELGMPVAYTTGVSGRARELERTFDEFVLAFALSIVFMYMILASQFESFVHPFTILLSLPMSVPFALLSLYISGDTLNLFSALGVLVLFGVVKKNAILQVDHINQLRARGMPRLEAVLQGNRDRLRPILMTTLALVAGMTPLAVGAGPGAEERRAIAIVVIGGQMLSLLLTLVVTPVAYTLLDDLRGKRRSMTVPAPGPAGP
jgi:HAE1 family hydrophobic/amphiphilic exporter-1